MSLQITRQQQRLRDQEMKLESNAYSFDRQAELIQICMDESHAMGLVINQSQHVPSNQKKLLRECGKLMICVSKLIERNRGRGCNCAASRLE
jgi:hypothetical protein